MRATDVVVVTRPGASWLLTAPPGAAELWLRARVVDADDGAVVLEAGDGSPLPPPGTPLVGAHGGGDGMRRFEITVRRHVPGSGDRFVVTSPTEIVKVERREGERVPIRLTAELVVGAGGGEVESIRATTVDLSPTGVGVVAPQGLRAGRRLLVLLHLDDEEAPVLAGGVVAAQQGGVRGGSRLGLDLQVIDPRDRERLSRHLAAAR